MGRLPKPGQNRNFFISALRSRLDHQPDEYIEIAQIEACIAFMRRLAEVDLIFRTGQGWWHL
jgi:hypothetical protein